MRNKICIPKALAHPRRYRVGGARLQHPPPPQSGI